MTQQEAAAALNLSDINIIRQWFNAVQDLNDDYLEAEDYALMEKLESAAHPETPADAQGRDDMVLVPRMPTEAMLIAGVKAGVSASPMPWCPETWKAMLAAAPQTAMEGE